MKDVSDKGREQRKDNEEKVPVDAPASTAADLKNYDKYLTRWLTRWGKMDI